MIATAVDTSLSAQADSDQPLVDFDPAGREFLTAFYRGRGVGVDDTAAKISVLREWFSKDTQEKVMVVSQDGVLNEASELRVLEYFFLDASKIQI